jgi:hypothetical protein
MKREQAIVLIHGIGEQRPMDTLRGFVNAVWTTDTKLHNPNNPYGGGQMWSKPDTVSESYELRRLTTPKNKAGIETDFYEFYWQHLMRGTNFQHVGAWIKSLLWRRPSTVPSQLRLAYAVLVVAVLATLGFAIYTIVVLGEGEGPIPPWLSGVISLTLVPVAAFVVKEIVGDAARYLHVAPANIQSRHAIRHAGVTLLKELHTRGYDRIIIVGHSLGSVIGYDILTHAWPAFNAADPVDEHQQKHPDPKVDALDALEALAIAATRGENVAGRIADAQRDYFRELRSNGNRWRVSDFITLGSPLAHSAILLARDGAALERKIKDREFPSCLPDLETVSRDKQVVQRFSYDASGTHRKPNHSAVFAPTRWTNLYFPCRWLVRGDLVGGPINGILGRGVTDVSVTTTARSGLVLHTLYWTPETRGASPHIASLRTVLDLGDESGVLA